MGKLILSTKTTDIRKNHQGKILFKPSKFYPHITHKIKLRTQSSEFQKGYHIRFIENIKPKSKIILSMYYQ